VFGGETVESSETLPYVNSNPAIKTFRHCLALDECRNELAPLYYTAVSKQDALEVWFSGGHDDVGGGSTNLPDVIGGSAKPLPDAKSSGRSPDGQGGSTEQNSAKYTLARIALRWMVGECVNADSGILFKVDGLGELIRNNTEDSDAAARCHIQSISNLLQQPSPSARVPPRILSPDEAATKASTDAGVVTSESTVKKGAVYCHTTVKIRKEKYLPKYEPKAILPDDTKYVDSKLSSLASLLRPADPNQPSGSEPLDKGKKRENTTT